MCLNFTELVSKKTLCMSLSVLEQIESVLADSKVSFEKCVALDEKIEQPVGGVSFLTMNCLRLIFNLWILPQMREKGYSKFLVGSVLSRFFAEEKGNLAFAWTYNPVLKGQGNLQGELTVYVAHETN